MTDFLNALKSYIVLSIGDITHIKDTISRHYAHMTSTERAEILSMAIHNHLNKHLVGIDDAHKASLKLSILSKTLAKHRYSITRLTIFDSILDLKLDDATKTDLAESWLTETAQLSVPRWALENYLIQKHKTTESIATQSDFVNLSNIIDSSRLSEKVSKTPYTKWFTKPLVGFFAIFLILIIGLSTYFVLNGAIHPELNQNFSLNALLDAKDYKGLSAMDRIYLIDNIEGYMEGDTLSFTLEKSRYNFGLMKQIDAFRFANFDYYAVKQYISKTRNGLIGSSEQFNQIIHEAYLNDIDPLLLFAIIGQEQAFVPNHSSDSIKILNNPYNVYHSWVEYNTTLRDSTQIAINTIKNRLNKAPFSVSPFKWLNVTYAEDTNWHNGVRLIYAHLVSIGRQ